MSFFKEFDLTKPCDACGGRNAGLKWCPHCKLSLCPLCQIDLIIKQMETQPNNVKLACPMCGRILELPK